MTTSLQKFRKKASWGDALALLILAMLLASYLYNLTGWRIHDDEGEYLYQVWRVTLGEQPYQDFLTPQLPVYLYLGAAVMKLTGPSLLAMRLYSVGLAFMAAILLYLLGRKRSDWLAGLVTAFLFLSHADVFKNTRIFRNEPLFLFLVTAGIVVATWLPAKRRRLLLALAGFLFSLATMTKLFGLLPFGGICAWLIWDSWREKRPLRLLINDLAYFVVPFMVGLLIITGISVIRVPDFLDFVLGHHLAQGSQQTTQQIIIDKVKLYWEYFKMNPVLVLVAVLSGFIGFWRKDARQAWAWQLPTAGAFFLLSRELGERHFMYLLPAFALLAGWLIAKSLRGKYSWWGRGLALVIILLITIPAWRLNADRVTWTDTDTGKVLGIIQERVDSDAVIIADDIGLPYYSRHATTYSGAALSHGAVTSGQITGEKLIKEIITDNVQMVIVDESLLTGNHLVFLRDYPRFHRFLQHNFNQRDEIRRDFQELVIWSRSADSPWVEEDIVQVQQLDGSRFGDFAELMGFSTEDTILKPGETLRIELYWRVFGPADNYWSVFTHLVDGDSNLVGQHDKVPYEGLYPPDRWWPGQIVDDSYAILIPEDTPAGIYRVDVGMYDHLTGERVPLFSQSGDKIPDDQVTLDLTVTIIE